VDIWGVGDLLVEGISMVRALHLLHPGRPYYEQQWFARTCRDGLTTVIPANTDFSSGMDTIRLDVHVPTFGRILSSTAKPASYVGLESALRDLDFDIIISLELFSTTTLQGIEQSKRMGCPLAILVYELIDSHPVYRLPPFSKILRAASHAAGTVICVSRKAADHALALGVPIGKLEVLSPGIDVQLYRPPISTVRRDGLIFVGRLAPHKGVVQVLQAYEKLLVTHPDLRLTVIGDGPMRGEVVALARRLPSIRFCGALSPAGVASELSQHDIFLAPSVDTFRLGFRVGAEQFGFAVVEAMAAGLAIVTTDCGALPEIAPPPNLIVAQGDSDALAGAVHRLLTDKAALDEVQRSNREDAINRFSLEGQATRLSEILLGSPS